MKSEFLQKHGKTLAIIGCIIAFAAITLIYFSPIFEGKRLQQHDIGMYKGMSKEIADYREATGETTLWTNSMFGGMPAWNISARQNANLFNEIHPVLSLGLPSPIGAVFIGMLGFFILMLVLDCSVWLSFVSAIAYGFSSYMFIIIGAGHNTKAFAIAYMAPVVAGVLLTYKGKYLWGSVLTAIALALEVKSNHLQITYYLLLMLVILIIAEFISDISKKKLGHFFKASACLLVAAVFAVMTNFTILYANYDYGKETTRGKPVLASTSNNQTKGLDRDYITQWSYGIGETWSLMIPNAKGGASMRSNGTPITIEDLNPSALENLQGNNKIAVSNCLAYWGDQPATNGPVYVGAIVVFLFVLGALTVKGKLKWALLIATLLSILLSWGKNFMWFTDLFIDYIPGYNKFRAVSMTLVIAEVTMPLLGFLGLAEIVKDPEHFKKNKKKFFIALGITVGICVVFYIAPKAFFSFQGLADPQYNAQLLSYFNSQGANLNQKVFEDNLTDMRIAIFRKDALRSLLYIILAAVPVFFCAKGKLKTLPAMAILAVLVFVDMFPIAKRYLNNDNFVDKAKAEKPFVATAADKLIMEDKSLDYRVFDLTGSPFNDSRCSYFHKSIGGYSGAKLRRYQDVIDHYMSGQLNPNVLNMLNTKYFIISDKQNNGKPVVQQNPDAFGNAWMANNIKWVETPNEEIDAIEATDLEHTAIINKEFEKAIPEYHPTDSVGSIALVDYKPNQLTYSFDANEDKLVVFSEIWTSKGWTMRIDGEEHPLLRANYLLRAAMVPAGKHEIVMRYEPRIWKVGGIISLTSSLVVILFAIGALVFSIINKFKNKKKEQPA